MADHEDRRAERLLDAQANAIALFDEVAARGLVAAGQGEQAVSDQVRDLANEMFGKTRHWHKRIVRSGPHTLFPYRENPPDRIIEADDIAFADFGPIFEEFEADLGRTYVLGDDPVKHRLRGRPAGHLRRGPALLRRPPRHHRRGSCTPRSPGWPREAGWSFGGRHAGHLVGEFPHEKIDGADIESYIAAGQHHPDAPPRQGRAGVPLDPGDPPDRRRARLRRLLRAAPRPRLSPESAH